MKAENREKKMDKRKKTCKMHVEQFVPSKTFNTSFRTNILSSSIKLGSSCMCRENNTKFHLSILTQKRK